MGRFLINKLVPLSVKFWTTVWCLVFRSGLGLGGNNKDKHHIQ